MGTTCKRKPIEANAGLRSGDEGFDERLNQALCCGGRHVTLEYALELKKELDKANESIQNYKNHLEKKFRRWVNGDEHVDNCRHGLLH